MADYTTLAHVQAMLQTDIRIDESTEPKAADVEVWIDGVTAQVDLALLDGGHTSPATDATQLSAFDLVTAGEVAWRVLVAKGAAGEDPEAHPYHKDFLKLVEALADGLMAVSSSTVHAPWSYTMTADVDDVTDPLGPSIRKDMTF